MSTPELAFVVDESIEKMRHRLSSTLEILSSQNIDHNQCEETVDMWITHLGNLAAAHLGNLAANDYEVGVGWACSRLVSHVCSLEPTPNNLIVYGNQLIEWLEILLSRTHQVNDLTLLDKTSLLIPEVPREELEKAFGINVSEKQPLITTTNPSVEDQALAEPENIFLNDSSENFNQFNDENFPAIYLPLVTIAKNAYDNISESIRALPHSSHHDEQFVTLLEAWTNSINEIAAMAELLELNQLTQICDPIITQYTSGNHYSQGITLDECKLLQQWITDLLIYIGNQSDNTNSERIVSILSEPQRSVLLLLLEAPESIDADNQDYPLPHAYGEIEEDITFTPRADDTSSEAVVEEIEIGDKVINWGNEVIDWGNEEESEVSIAADLEPENIEIESVCWNEENDSEVSDIEISGVANTESASENNSAIEPILAVLRQELTEMAMELSLLLTELTEGVGSSENKHKHIARYLTLVDQLAETVETLGLAGLQQVCLFISNNFTQTFIDDANSSEDSQSFFQSWPDQVLNYLDDPSNEKVCISLLDYLQRKEWPEPLNDEETRQLLVNLSQEMMVTEDFAEVEQRESTVSAEDVLLIIPEDTNHDLIDAFFQESPQVAAEFSTCIAEISNGINVSDNVSTAQRLAHTLKGSANLVGIKGIANLTHHMEDILEFFSTSPDNFPAPLTVTLQEASDCIETMLDSLQGKDTAPDDALQILQSILDWANRIDTGNIDEPIHNNIPSALNSDEQTETNKTPPEESQAAPTATFAAKEDSLHVPTRVIDDMFKMVGEMSISTSQIREYLKRLIRQGIDIQLHDKNAQQKRFELEDMVDVRGLASVHRRIRDQETDESEFDSLEMDQYDELHGSIHSFIETVSDSREMTQHIQSEITELDGMFLQQQRLSKELEQVVMTARMIPVSTITSRLQRAVRQASRATGKQVKLIVSGTELLLDSEVLNKLTDPLMHMLRNAVDHGIESEDLRTASGKSAAGQVHLKFLRDGNNIVANCIDDGGGLDYQKIQKTAIKNGLLKNKETLDEAQLARMILTPGFSTRDNATQVSGRGIGMDIVNTAVQTLGGTIDIKNADPCGCDISLRLPISLVTSHTIVVRVNNETLTIPSNTMARIISSGIGQFEKLGEEITFRIDDNIYPTKLLAELIGSQNQDAISGYENKVVLLVRADSGTIAVVVDQVVSSSELVVKSAGKYVRSVRGISGVSILGDGSVVPVLDIPELLRQPATKIASHKNTIQSSAKSNAAPHVLIVDDSLSVRKSLSQLIEDAGYQSLIARDGVEAMDVLKKQKPSLILTDLEMPRMTGLELASNIRADDNFNNVPIIMISSRSTKKHRQQAERAGVNEYITKPFAEDDLLSTMNTLFSA